MSTVGGGPGWWQASDGRWYPPETHPDAGRPPAVGVAADHATASSPDFGLPPMSAAALAPERGAAPSAGSAHRSGDASAYAPPTGPPGYGPPAPGPSGGPPGWGSPPAGAVPNDGMTAAAGPPGSGAMNGLAVASFVCSLFFFVVGIGSILAIVFGFISLGQITRSGGVLRGRKLAIAGLVIGFIGVGLLVLAVAIPTFLGVKSGAQDRAAQSNVNTASVFALSLYGQNQTFGNEAGAVSALGGGVPSMTFVGDAVGSTDESTISVGVDPGGQGVILVDRSPSGRCWGVLRNAAPSTSLTVDGVQRWPQAGSVGTWFTGFRSTTGSCSADQAVEAPWGSDFPAP